MHRLEHGEKIRWRIDCPYRQQLDAWGCTGDANHDDVPDSVQNGFTSGLCTELFRAYGEDGKTILGEIHRDALTRVIEDNNARTNKVQCKCIQEFVLLGDPSLKIGGYQ